MAFPCRGGSGRFARCSPKVGRRSSGLRGVESHDRGYTKIIETVTLDDDGDHDVEYDDQGFTEITPDEYDIGEHESESAAAVALMVKVLRDELNGIEASSSHFHRGIWYHSADAHQDMRTGAYSTTSMHLKGFSEAEEQSVFAAATKRRAWGGLGAHGRRRSA